VPERAVPRQLRVQVLPPGPEASQQVGEEGVPVPPLEVVVAAAPLVRRRVAGAPAVLAALAVAQPAR
jgi:hypothetical protein